MKTGFFYSTSSRFDRSPSAYGSCTSSTLPAMLKTWLIASVLLLPIGLPQALAAPITLPVTSMSSPPIPEGASTSVDFTVSNPTNSNLILDYALAIINGPGGDDLVSFAGVTWPSFLTPKGNGTFTYFIDSPPDSDGKPDPGLNTVSFYVAYSLATKLPNPQYITTLGLGIFVYNIGGGSRGTLNLNTLAVLNNCTFNPGNLPNPCNIGNNLLFDGPNGTTVEYQGVPQPQYAYVSVYDTPEPSTLPMLGSGMLGAGGLLRRRWLARS